MSRTATFRAAILTFGALLLSPVVGYATERSPVQLSQSAQADITDSDLQSYAAAASQVEALNTEWQYRIVEEAQTQQEVEEMRQQATEQMIQAIQGEGLSVDEYNQITQVSRQDPEVNKKIIEYMQ